MYKRRLFEGMFIGKLVSRTLSSRLSVHSKNDEDRLKDVCTKYINLLVQTVSKFSRIINELGHKKGNKNLKCIRVAKLGNKENMVAHPAGGNILYSTDANRVSQVNKALESEQIEIDGVTLYKNFNGGALSSLCRYARYGKSGLHSSFVKPLLFALSNMRKVTNTEISHHLLKLTIIGLLKLEQLTIDNGCFMFIDDIARQFLSTFDKMTFIVCQYSEVVSQTFTNLHGLATMGGPRGWTKDAVRDSIKDWVTGERSNNYDNIPFVQSKLNEWLKSWVRQGNKDATLTFDEFVTDPMRWATGGGAKKVKTTLHGQPVDVRNKWMWAIVNLKEGRNLYEVAKSEGNIAQVALKEEVKTRTVITTPQASYLRQCYLLYKLGDPKFLKSTIVDPHLTKHCIDTTEENFVCVDASQFDHTVSKAFIIKVLKTLADNIEDEELKELIYEEIESIETIKIRFDNELFDYENGLLSGWRITSLIGSLVSALCCEYINHVIGRMLFYIVQGDDIIMTSRQKLNKELILKCCDDFGIKTNSNKTTIGRFGEFLKYRYGNGHVQGYALRSVRSIFYANPWLDSSITQTPQEVVGKWHMFFSRLMNSSNGLIIDSEKNSILNGMTNDVAGWLGHTVKRAHIQKCMHTPVSLGGLGVFEWCKVTGGTGILNTVSILTRSSLTGDERFMESFGGPKDNRYVGESKAVKTKTLNIVGDYLLGGMYKRLMNVDKTVGELRFDQSCNIFRTIMMEVSLCRTVPPIVKEILAHTRGRVVALSRPIFLRKANRWLDVLEWLTGKDVKHSCPPSLFVDNRYDSETGKHIGRLASILYYNLPNVTAGTKMSMGFMAYDIFRRGVSYLHAL